MLKISEIPTENDDNLRTVWELFEITTQISTNSHNFSFFLTTVRNINQLEQML